MPENKTKPTDAGVEDYIAAIKDAGRRKDCEALVKLMAKASRQPAKMWGKAIVGFGSYHYKYESGREGEMCLVGFSSRAGDISIYGTGSVPGRDDVLPKLGKCKTGKGCLYIRRLADVDLKVLEKLIADAVRVHKAKAE